MHFGLHQVLTIVNVATLSESVHQVSTQKIDPRTQIIPHFIFYPPPTFVFLHNTSKDLHKTLTNLEQVCNLLNSIYLAFSKFGGHTDKGKVTCPFRLFIYLSLNTSCTTAFSLHSVNLTDDLMYHSSLNTLHQSFSRRTQLLTGFFIRPQGHSSGFNVSSLNTHPPQALMAVNSTPNKSQTGWTDAEKVRRLSITVISPALLNFDKIFLSHGPPSTYSNTST